MSPELVPLAMFFIGMIAGLYAGLFWFADFRQEARLVDLRNRWLEAEAAAKAGAELMEKTQANVSREISAVREFVSLWNYGAKDEAVEVLFANQLPYTFKGD